MTSPVITISIFISSSLLIIVSFVILFKDFRNLLNVLLGSVFLTWGLGLLFTGLTLQLYVLSLWILNAFRDVSIAMSVLSAFLFLASGYIVIYGGPLIKKWYFYVPLIVGYIPVVILGNIGDEVVRESSTGVKTTNDILGIIFSNVIPILLVVWTAILYFIATRKATDPQLKKRVNIFLSGILVLVFGLVIFIILGIIDTVSTISENLDLAFQLTAFFSWVVSSGLILLGFIIRPKEQEEVPEAIQ